MRNSISANAKSDTKNAIFPEDFIEEHSQFMNVSSPWKTKNGRQCVVYDTHFFDVARFMNCEYLQRTMLKAPTLKAQDVLVACKLFSVGEGSWTYSGIAEALELSVGEVHHALQRCRSARLVVSMRDGEIISKKHFHDLLVFAAPRIFYAVRGSLDLGWPTAYHLPTLVGEFEGIRQVVLKNSLPVVWPDPKGPVRGETLLPIYPTVPEAARKDALLYELLALTDVIRLGDIKYKKKAAELLERKIFGKTVE
jgi:hypothetical protein